MNDPLAVYCIQLMSVQSIWSFPIGAPRQQPNKKQPHLVDSPGAPAEKNIFSHPVPRVDTRATSADWQVEQITGTDQVAFKKLRIRCQQQTDL